MSLKPLRSGRLWQAGTSCATAAKLKGERMAALGRTAKVADAATLNISDQDIYLNSAGTWYRSYEKMGAHPAKDGKTKGYHFAVWAPGVKAVHVVGEFNGWDTTADNMIPVQSSGIWECFIPGVEAGQQYKFYIETAKGEYLYKADPYAFSAELTPGTASVTTAEPTYKWGDAKWVKARTARDHMHSPLNIYEVHLGSWKRHGTEPQGEPREDGTWPGPMDEFPAQRGKYYTYEDLADELVPYVKKMGYSHIEVLPVMEHPFDGSWGYQITGYYAPTSRFGTPEGLMHLIDTCHKAGIGVIFDWVPGGFCADAHGLAKFNGEMLYEREIHPNWGTHKFDFGRGEVRSFLISNALYWLDRFHVDGIRMDGVSSMLYLNFGIDDPSKKRVNKNGTEEDLDASAFIRQVNTTVAEYNPGVVMMAEESTAWPLVTYPPKDGGLGFHYKWDMGWMNDTLRYMQTDFPWRPGGHGKLTFSLMYAFNENFILPLSHDEVVHGKCSLITRQPGDTWRQFAGLRSLTLYQMTHPGAKLNFMGNEIAQYIEWRYYESIEWFLTEQFENHAKYQHFVEAINNLYLAEPALWREQYEWAGFEWLNADDSEHSMISFVRRGNEGEELVVVLNFDVAFREHWRVAVPQEGDYKEIFNSDDAAYGGSGQVNTGKISSRPEECDGRPNSVLINIPPLGGTILKRTGKSSYKPAKATAKTAEGGVKAVAKKVAAKKAPAKKAAAKPAAAASPAKAAKATPAKAAKATPAKAAKPAAKATKPVKAAAATKATKKAAK